MCQPHVFVRSCRPNGRMYLYPSCPSLSVQHRTIRHVLSDIQNIHTHLSRHSLWNINFSAVKCIHTHLVLSCNCFLLLISIEREMVTTKLLEDVNNGQRVCVCNVSQVNYPGSCCELHPPSCRLISESWIYIYISFTSLSPYETTTFLASFPCNPT